MECLSILNTFEYGNNFLIMKFNENWIIILICVCVLASKKYGFKNITNKTWNFSFVSIVKGKSLLLLDVLLCFFFIFWKMIFFLFFSVFRCFYFSDDKRNSFPSILIIFFFFLEKIEWSLLIISCYFHDCFSTKFIFCCIVDVVVAVVYVKFVPAFNSRE